MRSLSNGTVTTSIRDLTRSRSPETTEGIQIHSAWLENLGRTLLKFRWPLLFLGHTVVFVHPKLGRQSRSVNVGAGETRTIAVRFSPSAR